MNDNNKRIAKNTLFLYLRMLFTMAIALYTSRVVLKVLGVDDFGVYQTVGGIVAMLTFVNNALSIGSSRFLTYELGSKNFKKLKDTFSTVLTVHILLAIFLIVVAETFGLWYVYHKLIVNPDRLNAAVFAYHISVFTSFITITQVPYNSSIISHERMGVFAYVSIADAVLKLAVVYLLTIGNFDKLKFYAVLLFVVHAGVAMFYRWYCVKNFKECHYALIFKKDIFKNVLSYSGWNLFSSTSIALCNQGVIVLINAFFSPTVVAARAVANQVNLAANSLVDSFRSAVNPQIVKQYAAENYNQSRKLLLESTKFSYYLMLMLCMPICLLAEPLLKLWLETVPEYAPVFLQLAIVASLVDVFSRSFYAALYAKGQIKENSIISFVILGAGFGLIYVLFEMGFSPVSSAVVLFGTVTAISLVVKPVLLVKIVGYSVKEILSVFIVCFRVSLFAMPIPVATFMVLQDKGFNDIAKFAIIVPLSVLSVCVAVWFAGLTVEMKNQVCQIMKKIVKKYVNS